MREGGVTAICIFDGEGRHSAKLKEVSVNSLRISEHALKNEQVARRREAQRVTAKRGELEAARLQRLKALQTIFPTMPLSALQALRDLDTPDEGDLQALRERASDQAFSELVSDQATTESMPTTPQEIDVRPLYEDFKRSVAQLVSISKDGPEQDLEVLMTKAQAHLTMMEKDLWNGLLTSEVEENVKAICDALVTESSKMSKSFDRRTRPPTKETYQESQEILKAMGIRCLRADGETEAEGLASHIVLSGQADYVASEDTDVLVYGASLLRNITGGHEPLEILSADDVRAALSLDPATFTDFAILCGTDFSQRPKNVGPVRALNFLKAHGSIERVLEAEPKYPPRNGKEEYLVEVNAARHIFNGRLSKEDDLALQMELAQLGAEGQPDDKEVVKVLAKYRLGNELLAGHLAEDDWVDWTAANAYFGDSPVAS